jgi:hypothetical protein
MLVREFDSLYTVMNLWDYIFSGIEDDGRQFLSCSKEE